jgi:hypothetical protein
MHGGNHKRGLAHHSTTHGLYSKSMPVKLAARYEAAVADDELLSLRREAAILTALTDETLARFDTGETGALWLELRDLWEEMAALPPTKRGPILNEIGARIMRGASDAQAARELRSAILDKAKVAETEYKRLEKAHQMVTVERLMVFMGAIHRILEREVADRDARCRIADALDGLLGAGSEEAREGAA